MGIVNEDIERVKATVDFVSVVTEHLQLKKSGRRWVGLCPFHPEKTPSFSVNDELKLYKCFGCGAGGDAIRFVQELEHLTFVEAVERLAAKAGIQLRYDDAAEGKQHAKRGRLTEAMEKAVEWYHQRLLTAPDAGPARNYLRSRGYDGDLVRQFRIGWAPDEWDALAKALRLGDEVMKDTGLGFTNKIGKVNDFFRGRVLFPIFDTTGKPVAFGGRIMPGQEGSKYKNSPETPLYSKSRTLYGLNWAKAAVVETGEAIVCEGYTDVIAFHQAGLPRAVATCGTALADEHVRLLANFGRKLVLAYDADSAGQTAAERFYGWEQHYEIDIHVLSLPAGADPADVARNDPAALKQAVADARPFLAFRLDRVLSAGDLTTVEGRARAADHALAVIAEHPSSLVKDQYVMQVADRTRMEADRLRERLASGNLPSPNESPTTRGTQRSPSRPVPAAEERGRAREGKPVRPAPRAETEALRQAVHNPEAVAVLLDEVLFTDETHRHAYLALATSDTVPDAIAGADPDAADLLERVSVEEPAEDAVEALSRLIEPAAQRAMRDLESELRAEPDRAVDISNLIVWLRTTTELLRDDDTRLDAAEALVAWLVSRGET